MLAHWQIRRHNVKLPQLMSVSPLAPMHLLLLVRYLRPSGPPPAVAPTLTSHVIDQCQPAGTATDDARELTGTYKLAGHATVARGEVNKACHLPAGGSLFRCG